MLPIRPYKPSFFFTSIFDDMFDINSFKYPTIQCPVHDVIENDKEFIIEMMLAGIKKEDISIKVDKDVLKIKAVRNEVKDLKYNRKESFTGTYKRLFVLPELADVENISASLTDGVLTVKILKLEKEPEPIKKIIEIK
jgi:HSP20 family protein